MRIYHGRTDKETGPVFEEGMFGKAFVAASGPSEAFTTGPVIDCWEMDEEKFRTLSVVDIRSPKEVRDYIVSGRTDADVMIYPYPNQCSVQSFLIAFLTERSLECLTLVEND